MAERGTGSDHTVRVDDHVRLVEQHVRVAAAEERREPPGRGRPPAVEQPRFRQDERPDARRRRRPTVLGP